MDHLRTLRQCLPRFWRTVRQFRPYLSAHLGAEQPLERDSGATAERADKDPLIRRTKAREDKGSTWWAMARLRTFVLPHWMAIAIAFLLLLGEAGMDLLKPWPLKLTFDVILRQKTLEGITLYLLVGVSTLVVAIALFEGLLGYLAAFYLNRAGRTIISDLRATLFDHIQNV